MRNPTQVETVLFLSGRSKVVKTTGKHGACMLMCSKFRHRVRYTYLGFSRLRECKRRTTFNIVPRTDVGATVLPDDEPRTSTELAGRTGAALSGLWLSTNTPALVARIGAQAQAFRMAVQWSFTVTPNTIAQAIDAVSGPAKP